MGKCKMQHDSNMATWHAPCNIAYLRIFLALTAWAVVSAMCSTFNDGNSRFTASTTMCAVFEAMTRMSTRAAASRRTPALQGDLLRRNALHCGAKCWHSATARGTVFHEVLDASIVVSPL